MSENRDRWLDYRAAEILNQHGEAGQLLLGMPEAAQVALRALCISLYLTGRQHERTLIGTGRETAFYVPPPTLEIVDEIAS